MNDHAQDKIHILVVEDDPNLSMVLQDYLELLHYVTVLGKDGEEGLALFNKGKFDLCILDVMLPKLDGFSLASAIRAKNETIPIIFLTAKALKEDRIKGFQHGCDDYITKPFSTEELSLRIKAILKRCSRDKYLELLETEEVFSIGSFEFDAINMVLRSPFGDQTLTRKEAALLKLLCLNTNKLLTRETALKTVWGESDYFLGRSMDVFITRLRKYLREDPNVNISNVHGTGFKLEVKEGS
ncbi:MAG: response regulator transcription factor [Bacteroidetes bacterium]|nr:response regulator transcription factor [Bacteroidota bacterium]